MPIRIAKTLQDLQSVKPLAEDPVWEHARKFLSAAEKDPFADHLRWLQEDGDPVACVQVFLHQYPIGCAQVGMGLPEYPFVPSEQRGRGYFKTLMADLFKWFQSHGYPLVYDHGQKGLYTRLGYAPCFHHTLVLIRVADALRVQAPGRAEKATEADLALHQDLFRKPFPLGRGLQCRDEKWRPDPQCVRLIRTPEGPGIRGFVVLHEVLVGRTPNGLGFADFQPPTGGAVLTLTDAWGEDLQTAAELLRTAAEEAEAAGFAWLRLNTRRRDPLARIAVLAGGELRWSAAQERDHTSAGEDVDAFYLTNLRLALEQLQPELNARWQKFSGPAPPALRVGMEDEEVVLRLAREVTLQDPGPEGIPSLRLPRKAMTQAIMGYATPPELALLHEGSVVPEGGLAVVEALFPAREPHLIHEELAFAEPAQWGLVP